VGTIAAYIGAQEELINSLLGVTTNVYESKVAATFFWQPKGALFWTTLAVIAFFFCCFVALTWLAYDSLNTFGGGALLAGELIILGILALWILIGQENVRTRIRSELGIKK
jgi:hypothetical protein